VASIEASDVQHAVVELHAPDTVVISGLHRQHLGTGTFKRQVAWRVEHIKAGEKPIVEITVLAGTLSQTGLCSVG
jgi:hypothetical protein